MPPGTTLAERMWMVPNPIVLAPASRALLGRKMELYAGMMENMDFHVGRLVAHLKEIDEYQNATRSSSSSGTTAPRGPTSSR